MSRFSSKQWTRFLGYFILLVACAYAVKIALKPSDFTVFLEAGSMIHDGKSPYNEWIFVSEGNFCFYFYSPLWAVLLIPFSFLPQFVPQLLWLLANLYFLSRIWKLIGTYLPIPEWSQKKRMWFIVLALAFLSRFILYNFEMVQMTIFLIWGSLEALRLINREKLIAGGALMALVINIKILPLVFLPYLIYRRKFKAVGWILLFSVFFLIIPALFVGWDVNLELIKGWAEVINPSNSEHLLETDLGPHSLTALIPVLFTETHGILSQHRNVLSLSVANAVLIMNLLRLVLIGLTVYFLKWPPFKKVVSKKVELYELSYLFLLIPLIFPHQQKYAFFCLAPAVYYCFYYLFIIYGEKADRKGGRFYIVVGLLSISFFLLTGTTDVIVGRDLNEIFQHYKLITYGTLLFIPILILCKPSHMESKV